MQLLRVLPFACLAGAVALPDFDAARNSITAEEIRAHVYLLASDALAGRAPGSPGGEMAAEYVKSRFMAMGLDPVQGSYFQTVPLVGIKPDPASLTLAFETDGGRVVARHPDDVVLWPGVPAAATELDAELVFVGYGIDAPAWDWDDFGDRDLAGKVLLILAGDPPAPPDEPGLFEGRALTYHGRWTSKLEEARRRGAAGAVILHDSVAAGYGWDVVRSSWSGEHLQLQPTEDDAAGSPPVRVQGWLTEGLARAVLGGADLDLDELLVRAARRDFHPVATGITVRARVASTVRRLRTRNVVGYRPGTDPERSRQVVVFTAHHDHLGIGPAVDGDSIYNGAYDNASGVALLLEIAEAFAALDEGTARGVLFIATAAEEPGLLGARHYVRRPLFPLSRTAAVINVDGASVWGPTDDVVALGADRSTLGERVRARAGEMGLEVVPDPDPGQGLFFRSDQFPFALAGVPAIHVRHGTAFRSVPQGWDAASLASWQHDHYHKPSDEYHPTLDFTGAVQQGRLIFGVGWDVATADDTPEWSADAPFRGGRDRQPR